MATTTRKRPRTAAIKPEAVSTTIAFLEGLPEKEKEDLSLREAIGQMQETIKTALARGYSYEDVAKMLSEKGIKISALTLKNYAPSGRRQSSKTKSKRGRKSVAEIAASNGTTESEPAASKSAPSKARKTTSRSTKTRGQAKADTKSETTVKPTRRRKATTPTAETQPATRKRRQAKA